MMLEEHLACPECGYDLYGIPEVRCPECGFRYDAAALRSMTASAEWTRLAAARTLTVRATFAAALAVPAVCASFGVFGLGRFCIIAVAFVAAFLTWAVITNAYRGLASIPNLFTLFVASALAVGFLISLSPPVALVCSVIALALAWFIYLRYWPELPPQANTRSPELRRSVVRYSVVGTSVLVVASLLFVVGLLG